MRSRAVVGRVAVVMTGWALAATPLVARQAGGHPLEAPLRVQDGRLVVTLLTEQGAGVDFVLGLGFSALTQSGAARLGADAATLTIGGAPVDMSGLPTAPDGPLGSAADSPVGIIGGETLRSFDILIDAPGGRLLLKPVGRSVRWDGVALSRPVSVRVLHDVLVNADVEIEGQVFGALVDLVAPAVRVNEPVLAATGLQGDRVTSFRMGYAGWPDLPVQSSDDPTFSRWDGQGKGFVIVGAAVAWDCALAVSWTHQELRTCLR